MPRSRYWILVLAPLALAACDDAGEPELEPAADAAVEPEAPAPVAAAPSAEQALPAEQEPDRDYLVQMVPLGDRTLSGTVGFTPAGEQTEVTVSILGGEEGLTSQGHIHTGEDCDQIGGVVQPLPAVTIGEPGSAERIGMDMQQVMDGSHLVVYHEPGGNPGAPVLCADIPLLPPNLPTE